MKKLIIGLLLCPLVLAVSAQEARSLFVHMPDSLSPLLSAVNRADCIDFLDSKMRAQVTNTFGGKSEMTMLTPDYIRIQLTSRSTWQMKVLPLADSTRVICTVSTAYAPAPDSHIRFYDADWHPLPAADYLDTLPAMTDFLLPPSDTGNVYRQRDARRQADLLLLDASLAPDSMMLTFSLATPRYMEKETADELKPFIRRQLIYVWQRGKFRPRRP